MSNIFRHILVLRPGPFPRLDSALSVDGPDASGRVPLYEPIAWADGLHATVPQSHCFAYDTALAKQVNGLVDCAYDDVQQATNLIIDQGVSAFETAEDTTEPILH